MGCGIVRPVVINLLDMGTVGMKVLNLYAGLGGNRRKWGDDVEVTAVEYRPDIASFYQDQHPQDLVIIGDAHQYLLDHYKEFDFIWCSTPCPTHSRARYWASSGDTAIVAPIYPDMALYQEILFLKHYFKGNWVVENVKPYYEPLIQPTATLGRHLFWSNFIIPKFHAIDADIKNGTRGEWEALHGISLEGYKFQDRTDKLLRNCVHPDLGLHVFESAKTADPLTVDQLSLL